ncbi:MAG TPA: alpha/beta hydrolase-fold protein [Phototrophicaceae bacterium]|jgi:enterochelin esterase-like enzyme|nr:alpha/beta hydrolase-fold protein [Phototrophicaceae bacterium]
MPDQWLSFEAFLNDALNTPLEQRQNLVSSLLRQHPSFPWVDGKKATFIYARPGARTVAVNLDTIKTDPPFLPMENLAGTSLWHATLEFAVDDLLDYLIVVNDPMTPLANEQNIVDRVSKYWHTDPYNPVRIQTTQMDVSVLQMSEARPFPDWSKLQRISRGTVYEHSINSVQLKFSGRKLWIYTPPGYESSNKMYPLLILNDGQWSVGPMQIPAIADTLIKHNQMRPVIIAMVQSGDQASRIKTLVGNDRHYLFILTELLPFIQTQYRIDSTNLGIGGVGVSAIAAAHAALLNPAVFSQLIMISPPLGKGADEEQLASYTTRFENAAVLPKRIFQSVGRYEMRSRFYRPGYALQDILQRRTDTAYRFAEIGSGHGLVGFRSIMPEAMAWAYPGEVGV